MDLRFAGVDPCEAPFDEVQRRHFARTQSALAAPAIVSISSGISRMISVGMKLKIAKAHRAVARESRVPLGAESDRIATLRLRFRARVSRSLAAERTGTSLDISESQDCRGGGTIQSGCGGTPHFLERLKIRPVAVEKGTATFEVTVDETHLRTMGIAPRRTRRHACSIRRSDAPVGRWPRPTIIW